MTSEMLKKRKRRLCLGMIAAALLMTADLLWQVRGDQKVGTVLGAFADTAWLDVAVWRIVLSDILTAIAVPLYYIGFTEMYRLLRERARDKTERRLAALFRVGMLAGTMGFLFIHAICLNLPLIMQAVAPYVPVETAAQITNSLMMCNIAPMIAYYLAADGILTAVMAALIWRGSLPVSRFALLCNPVMTAGIAQAIAVMPWPLSQLSYGGEACGHLLIMVVGLIVTAKDEKKMPKRRRKSPPKKDERPILNLDDEPDADVTFV